MYISFLSKKTYKIDWEFFSSVTVFYGRGFKYGWNNGYDDDFLCCKYVGN